MSYKNDLNEAEKLIRDAVSSIQRILSSSNNQQDVQNARQALSSLNRAKSKIEDVLRDAERADREG